jgi:hypothetical protein
MAVAFQRASGLQSLRTAKEKKGATNRKEVFERLHSVRHAATYIHCQRESEHGATG